MNTTNPTARERLHAKIRALLAKTIEAGCTEAEAFAAASLARDLMDKYNVEHGDLTDEQEPWHTEYTTREGAEVRGTKRRKNARPLAFSFRQLIFVRVGRFCDCHGIHNRAAGTIRFHGRQSDALFAAWLLEALDAFAYRAWGGFEAVAALSDDAPSFGDKEAFLSALAFRLNERLDDAIRARTPPNWDSLSTLPATCNDRQLAARNHAMQLWPGLTNSRPDFTAMRRDAFSAAAGADAASRASFNRPMGTAAVPKPLLLK